MLRRQPQRIVELGLGQGERALRLIDVAASYMLRAEIQYIGIDPFEDRLTADKPGLTLISAHRLLKASGARIKLIPGNPWEALIRSANHLGTVDMLILSALDQQSGEFPQFWFYVPRLLHEKSVIFQEVAARDGKTTLQEINRREVLAWAAAPQRRKAA
jgi:hypothetical protein